ncbi:hypothetical protein MJO29_009800 [Puccinia striiformis f. sp. tritici]|uniref:hypothetical protein n=1 Tax=Puccinia striiformis f. sp. tritici TaxID=168172 RepID=UPI0020072B66|nr:hypothetical protein Pst134EA_017141 [Puccinia striiformis f. sp. tritici]KAH9460825.1 hypothetical protein Pst134EA_017141 [Puccinia striiformis f. sp. tritici]KAI7951126.1 hypothetical protein MJO29_009800 [Puccinia striiformis f. sp. tritici]KAI9630478.1 hypothetical protein KEM48_013974 [Puccinia striiformis f. sp. tritici PST-130]
MAPPPTIRQEAIPLWKQYPKHSGKSSRLDRITGFDVLSLFDPPKPKQLARQVFINLSLPSQAWKSNKKGEVLVGHPTEAWEHPSNQIKTAKYSLLTFIPRNLLEQFRRIANVFFLSLVILQFIPKFSQVSPALAALPLLSVLAITAIKDAYEDVRRHAADYKTNHQLVQTISSSTYTNQNITTPAKSSFKINWFHKQPDSELLPPKKHWWSRRRKVFPADFRRTTPPGSQSSTVDAAAEESNTAGFEPTCWQDLRVGDFVRLKNDDSVPADMIICATSDKEENVCFIETKNLDGETNLKSRHALPSLSHLRSAHDCANSKHRKNRFVVENEVPDANMFAYSAAIVFPDLDVDQALAHEQTKDGHQAGHRVPVDMNSVLLRGTVVRNTEWVIGLIVFTGPDTKIMMNSSGTRSKRSKVERQMNPMVFINLGILALMCIFNAIGTSFSDKYYRDRGSYWTVEEDSSGDNPTVNGLIGFANAMITYQNIVPISLYISIEFVRTLQAYFIWADDEITDNERRTLARSWNLSDDLGQIQYVFSDKTGTLTQNLMQFRQCSVAGKIYRGRQQLGSIGEEEEEEEQVAEEEEEQTVVGGYNPVAPYSPTSPSKSSPTQEKASGSGKLDEKPSVKVKADPAVKPFKDSVLMKDLAEVDSDQARSLYGFFACLALCHTVLVSEDDDGSIKYKAQSPDEQALVQAAAAVGFVFRGRDKNILRLQVPSTCHHRSSYSTDQHQSADITEIGSSRDQETVEVNEYELLEVNEFTSARKRMSVVVRRLGEDGPEPGELYLLVKGADNVIFERLGAGQDELKQTTDDQLEQFASEGLRTLCLAYRKLESSELEAWSKKYAHACSQLGPDREKFIDRVQDELERDLILLGATAIEDKLQEGVPRAIADLKRAGIKVWVATGDKLETAVAIARTCHLIGHDMNLIVIRGGEYGSRTSAYQQIRKSLIDFFDGRELVDQLKELPPDHSPEPGMQSPTPTRVSLPMSTRDDLASIVGEDNGQRAGGYGLVIDGASLNHALEEPFTREALLELATRCAAVVCCRTSPKQKSEIVRLVKEGIGAQTLAIGDGANDVSMIQTADIGVGVSGEEGMQAVNSSDYAIAKFRFLTKLLFVHGHWSYDRNARMIGNFFYKEIIGIVALWLFQFWCAYSTTVLYEYTYLLFYNVFWTLLPVIGIGVFDQDVAEKVLIAVPELYSIGREGHLFGLRRFVMYMLQGIYQGSVCFFLITFAYDSTSARNDGFDVSMNEFSTVVIIAIIIACNFFHGIDQSIWNWWLLTFVLIGPTLIVLYTVVYSAVKPNWIWTASYGNNHFFWPSAYFWLGLLITVVLSLGPHYLFKYYQEMYYPNDLQILKYVHKHDPDHDFQEDEQMPYKRENEKYLEEFDHNDSNDTTNNKQDEPPLLERMKSEAPSSLQPVRPEILRSRTSLTHDMATGQLSPHGRGFGFDQADGVGQYAVGNRLRKYNTSNLSLGAAIPEEANNGNTTKSKTSRSGRLGNLQRAFGGGSFGTQHRRQGTQATTAGSVSRPASLAKRITVFLHPHTHNHNETRTSDHNNVDPSLPLDNHHSHSAATPSDHPVIGFLDPSATLDSSNDEIQEVHPPDLHSSSQ